MTFVRKNISYLGLHSASDVYFAFRTMPTHTKEDFFLRYMWNTEDTEYVIQSIVESLSERKTAWGLRFHYTKSYFDEEKTTFLWTILASSTKRILRESDFEGSAVSRYIENLIEHGEISSPVNVSFNIQIHNELRSNGFISMRKK